MCRRVAKRLRRKPGPSMGRAQTLNPKAIALQHGEYANSNSRRRKLEILFGVCQEECKQSSDLGEEILNTSPSSCYFKIKLCLC
jgi:hypothetical protein